jgi:hypothetical protein
VHPENFSLKDKYELVESHPLRRLCQKAKVKARESRGVRRTFPVRRSAVEMKRNAEIGLLAKSSRKSKEG